MVEFNFSKQQQHLWKYGKLSTPFFGLKNKKIIHRYFTLQIDIYSFIVDFEMQDW